MSLSSSKNQMQLVLASSSKYRQSQLKQLELPFVSDSPDIDESILPGETAYQLVVRLAETKAKTLQSNYPNSLIIGADQVLVGPLHKDQSAESVDCEHILGKAGNYEKAFEQLTRLQGSEAELASGLALYNSALQKIQSSITTHRIKYRQLSSNDIEQYLLRETPYDCAGSAKIEKLGIGLIETINGSDPSSIIGLPLISLITMLKNEGISIF